MKLAVGRVIVVERSARATALKFAAELTLITGSTRRSSVSTNTAIAATAV